MLEVTENCEQNRDEVVAGMVKYLWKKFGVRVVVKAVGTCSEKLKGYEDFFMNAFGTTDIEEIKRKVNRLMEKIEEVA